MRKLRSLILATAVAACCALCVAVAITVVKVRGNEVSSPMSTAAFTIKGFRSALYDRDHLQLRVSGDLVSVSNLKVFGSFSLGFLYSLVGRNITFETFEQVDGAYEPLSQVLSLDHISALVAHHWRGTQLGRAELGPVTVIEHRQGREKVLLQAASCRVTATGCGMVCRDGVVASRGGTESFRELACDGDTLMVTSVTEGTHAYLARDVYAQAPVSQLR